MNTWDGGVTDEALQRVATGYLVRRYGGPGNPLKAEIRTLGAATAIKVPFAPSNEHMNGVHGLSEVGDLPRVLSFYRETDQACWIGLSPRTASAELTQALIDAGFAPESHTAVLGGLLSNLPEPPLADGVEVQTIARDELEVFLTTLARGFEAPETILPSLVRNQSFWIDETAFRLLLARVGGEPVGAAVLHLDGHVAYLASGATLPGLRRRGVHAALIGARLRLARELGCTFVTGQARFGSTSHHNQQRAGLSLRTVQQTWTQRRRP